MISEKGQMTVDDQNIKDNPETNEENQQTAQTKTSSNIKDILEEHRGEYHAVVIQNYPDPDAIACAFAHRLISKQFDIEVDILHSGEISHQQNIALVKLIGVQLQTFEKSLDLKKYDGAVYIDNQGTTASEIVEAMDEAGIPTLIIVDHHEPQEILQAEFSDIRRRAGATATIYSEYLERGDLIKLDKAKKDHVLVATALFHGLLTDTGGFIRASKIDFHAAGFLSALRDPEMLEQIMSRQRSKQTMDIIRRALEERIIVENYSIVGVGYLRAEDRDTIPQVADFLLTEEYIHTAIVYGIVLEDGQETLIGSMRTSKFTLDPDEFIKEVFGRDSAGRYFGGGKMMAGGFEIPIEFLSGDSSEDFLDLKWRVYDKQIKSKIYKKIGVDQNTNNA
jgi:nanoRNase/pAp phosphatase (c-di-AMP/oligoRNAs hydrolase)